MRQNKLFNAKVRIQHAFQIKKKSNEERETVRMTSVSQKVKKYSAHAVGHLLQI